MSEVFVEIYRVDYIYQNIDGTRLVQDDEFGKTIINARDIARIYDLSYRRKLIKKNGVTVSNPEREAKEAAMGARCLVTLRRNDGKPLRRNFLRAK